MSPRISVVIPVYNRPHLIKHSVETVLAQTLPVQEIILIDDGSTEDVEGEIRRNMAENPAWRERVRYYYQENQGQSVAANNGVARATGEWIAFNASDDLWLPNKLEWQFRALEQFKDQCDFCFTDAWFMNNPYMKMTLFQLVGKNFPDSMGVIPDPARLTVGVQPAWLQTVVLRKDLFQRVGGFDPQLRYGEDNDLVFRMALHTKFCYVNMPMVLIDRAPGEQRHVGVAKDWSKEDFRLRMSQCRFEKFLGLSKGLAPDIQKEVRDNLREIHSSWSNRYLHTGEYEKAREAAARSVGYGLTLNSALKWILTRVAPKLGKAIVENRARRNQSRNYGIGW